MLFSILSGGNIRDIIINLLLTIPVIMIALSFHEAAHGFIAYKMGDHTAYNLGRVTMNPLKHLDPLGTLCMFLVGYGWAKPVPINSRNFKDPKKGMALTALAGPVSNLILGIIGAILYALTYALFIKNADFLYEHVFLSNIVKVILNFFFYFGFLNIGLMLFNLIPVPPFDGSRIISVFLPTRIYFGIMKYERYILYGILLASFACSYLFDFSPISWLTNRVFGGICSPFLKLFFKIFF